APLSWLLQQRSGRAAGIIAALLPAGLFTALLTLLPVITAGSDLVERHSWVPSFGVTLTLRLDGLSLLFALLVTGIGTLVTIYAGSYFRAASVRRRTHFVLLIQLFMAAMLGTGLADNLLVMYLFWEWTSLISFLLIGFEAARPEARKAALQSLLMTVAGGLSMFAGILLLGRGLGTFSFTEILADPARFAALDGAWVIAALFLAGALTKSAQAPFHFWLPRAMEAPTPASAYLHSATMVKLGIFLLARLDQPFSQLPGYGTVLITFGLATMLMASLNTLRERQYKALLAHSTVASLGMLVFLLGLPGSGARTAMLAFLLGHALYKATLFFAAGSVIAHAGTGELSRLTGLRRALPLTAAAALLAGISMAGLPPLFGFIAKEAMLENVLGLAAGPARSFGLAGLVLASVVLVAVAWLSGVKPFRGAGGNEGSGETGGLAAGPLILGSAGLLFALFSDFFVTPLLQAAARTVTGEPLQLQLALWHGPTPALAWSALVIVLGAALIAAWPRLQALLPGPAAHLAPTSEGGYEAVF
ncbi:MAG TPA: proton-conducting transporter membrane subunit, partial [Deinococcales bacterium]|nr:proton-conducting transporter membrane subunit [Deinococcales bacterium]